MLPSAVAVARIFVITGAGISAESGIPTFRGADGYWRNRDPLTLATPEAFAREPDLVWEWYRERRQMVRSAQPNAGHDAIVELASSADDFLLLTQNVDNLHIRADWQGKRLAPEHLVQIHGDLFVTRCPRCSVERVDEEDEPGVPRCPRCGALMRPGVVWFGESLDPRNCARVEEFLAGGPSDIVLVVGTTAVFDYIVSWARRAAGSTGAIVEVNPEETRLSPVATATIRAAAATVLPSLVADWVTGTVASSPGQATIEGRPALPSETMVTHPRTPKTATTIGGPKAAR